MQSLIKFDAPLPDRKTPLVLALGVFDGVHLGHRKIMAHLRELAEKHKAVPAAVTFDPHPRKVLFPGEPLPLLLPLQERLRLLRQEGALLTGIISFTGDFSCMEPERFLENICCSQDFSVAGICVGSQWRFGRGGRGSSAVISAFASAHGLDFIPCEELTMEGLTVSSSAIRKSTAEGNLLLAREMLGRPVRLFGEVARGNHIAGTLLEAPTANMTAEYGVLPPDGVYSGRVFLENTYYPAAVNIGFSPTFRVNTRRVEAHLLDFSGSLYGKTIELELLSRMRDERCFSSPRELTAQIKQDIVQVRKDFSGEMK